jgi:soluble lytic murein transglycosylase-like protein
MTKTTVCAAVLALALPLAGCVSAEGGSTLVDSDSPPRAEPVAERNAAPDYSGRAQYDALIARYAAENDVPLPLAHAVIEKESGYNAKATGRGTVGLMQIKPATARGIGYKGSTSGLYDPATNLEWGMKYLGTAHKLGGGDVCGTALRYQGGHRATRQSAMTRRYCAELKAIMAENGG